MNNNRGNGKGKNKGKRYSIKSFLNEWKGKNLKEMDKDDRTYTLYSNLDQIAEFYIKSAHYAHEEVSELFDRMETAKFADTMKRIQKTDDVTPVPIVFAIIIGDFIERRNADIDEDVRATYLKIIKKLLKDKSKKIADKVGIDKDIIQELLLVVPDVECIGNKNYMGVYISRVAKKMYMMAKEEDQGLNQPKTIKKIFKALFGKENMEEVARSLLLEKKDTIRNYSEVQKSVWNAITDFALDVVEGMDEKKDIRKFFEAYVDRRIQDANRQRDAARRVTFVALPEEDFPNISKVVTNMSEKDKFKRYL